MKELEDQIVEELTKRGFTITTAESCTGGLLSGRLINSPGASAVYNQGFITYANEAKENLIGVSHKTLESFGAVSEQTAKEMAKGAARVSEADVAVGITGIAGPDGGTKEKPVGLVYIGCFVCGEVKVEKNIFSGDRRSVREQAVEKALMLVKEMLTM